jgi:hypothetical protein
VGLKYGSNITGNFGCPGIAGRKAAGIITALSKTTFVFYYEYPWS